MVNRLKALIAMKFFICLDPSKCFFYIACRPAHRSLDVSIRISDLENYLLSTQKKISNFVRTNFFLCKDISVIMEGRVMAQLILP